ncbi:MAG: DNA mismatch repair protein MutS [Marinilabiliales bacterium]
MEQYNRIKSKHPDAILLFRVGDFYETFGEDAIRTSKILGITLTRRANGAASYVELAGFPYHALDNYLPKLIRAGQRVAICEQLEDPKLTKKIVKRGVTELVTPGVALNDNVIENKENNFLAAIYPQGQITGISFLDISTGEFYAAEGRNEYIDKLLQSFKPKEVLLEKSKLQWFYDNFGKDFYTYTLDDWVFNEETARDRLIKQFEVKTLKGYGIENMQYGVIAAGCILHYLDITRHDKITHISGISRIDEEKYVWLDKFTIRNLELFNTFNEGASTLFDVIDDTLTPMGSRLLKRWIAMPLKDIRVITDRYNVVDFFINNQDVREEIESHVKMIGDLERLVAKIAVGRINPKEILQLKNSLDSIKPVKNLAKSANDITLNKLSDQLNECELIRSRIEKEINIDAPNQVNKGNVINKGVNKTLDELRELAYSGKDYLKKIQEREIQNTGIPSLKIAYNNVFGYYIEVTNTHKDKVPDTWIRKQTLVNAERYITEELKEYENKILGAEESILQLETELYNSLVADLVDYIPALQLNANIIANIDCLLSHAKVAIKNNYCKPEVFDNDVIDIKAGRHPVIEKHLPEGEEYIPNDVYLDSRNQQIMMITGPNMAGKSALLRQVALIVIMAQIGSYVPAESAKIGIIDKIFTRVGASDNISLGESTFMVEMNESANIMNNLSENSLVLLDEIGRGTSTYDGISIAWAIAEYIHEHPKYKAKTLFATHYHELNEMEKTFPRIRNYNVSVKEINNKVIFLRKLQRGGSEHSFGIHVARMAGMPKSIIKRAETILKELESEGKSTGLSRPVKDIAEKREGFQLSFFQLDDPVLKNIRDEIINTDIDNLTPIEALNKLYKIKKLLL